MPFARDDSASTPHCVQNRDEHPGVEDRRRYAARDAGRCSRAGRAAATAWRRRDVPVQCRARPYRARDQAHFPARILQQGATNLGRCPLRRDDAAVRDGASGAGHRTSWRRCDAVGTRRGLRDGSALLGSRQMAGWCRRRRRRMDGETDAKCLRALQRCVQGAAPRAWRRRLADERRRAASDASSRFRLLLGRPRDPSAPAGVERGADPLSAAADDPADARRDDRRRRRDREAKARR